MISTDPQLWIQSILVILLYSFLIRENPLYYISENTLVSATLGHTFAIAFGVIASAGITPILGGDLARVIPFLMGLTLLGRFSRRYAWISRYGTAYLVGTGNGLILRSILHSDIIKQIQATSISLAADPITIFNNLFLASAVLSTMMFFIFTIPRFSEMPGTKYVLKWARWVMMIAFSFSFASTITTRVVLGSDVLKGILVDWLGLSFV